MSNTVSFATGDTLYHTHPIPSTPPTRRHKLHSGLSSVRTPGALALSLTAASLGFGSARLTLLSALASRLLLLGLVGATFAGARGARA